MKKSINKLEEEYQKMLNDSDKDTYTKLELSEAFLESIDSLIEDWVLVRKAVNESAEKLRRELKN